MLCPSVVIWISFWSFAFVYGWFVCLCSGLYLIWIILYLFLIVLHFHLVGMLNFLVSICLSYVSKCVFGLNLSLCVSVVDLLLLEIVCISFLIVPSRFSLCVSLIVICISFRQFRASSCLCTCFMYFIYFQENNVNQWTYQWPLVSSINNLINMNSLFMQSKGNYFPVMLQLFLTTWVCSTLCQHRGMFWRRMSQINGAHCHLMANLIHSTESHGRFSNPSKTFVSRSINPQSDLVLRAKLNLFLSSTHTWKRCYKAGCTFN